MAFGGGTLQVTGTLILVTLILAAFISIPQALTLGAIIALSSTTIVLRMLVDKTAIDSIHGRSSLSILLLQDIAIVPLVLMITLFIPSTQDVNIFEHIVKVIASVVGLILFLYEGIQKPVFFVQMEYPARISG